jgi:hypothetical protein
MTSRVLSLEDLIRPSTPDLEREKYRAQKK